MHSLPGSSLPAAGCPLWTGQERAQSSAQGRAGAAHGHRLWHPLHAAAECGQAVGVPSQDLDRGVPPGTTPHHPVLSRVCGATCSGAGAARCRSSPPGVAGEVAACLGP